jgi:Uma2 family endonuclease
MAPVPRDAHADIPQQLAELLAAPARAAGLFPTGAQFNIGRPDDYRVPDRGLHRTRTWGTYAPSAALVLEIVSPGDETWNKLPFDAARQVDELLIVDPQKRTVDRLELEHGDYQPNLGPVRLAERIDWPAVDPQQP